MQFQALKAKLDAARQLDIPIDGATFNLKCPTDHAWRMTFEQHMIDGRVIHTAGCRALLDAALVGWSGVTVGHFGEEPASEAVEFSPDARAALLDCRVDICDQLFIKLTDHRVARGRVLETERKN